MHLGRIFAVAAAVALCAHGSAWADEAPKWGAHVDVEGWLGTARNLGEVDLFLPLAQGDRTLLFADIRGRTDDDGGHEGNFGLALRHMLPSGWNIGAYGYYDRKGTELDNYFNQATLGVEALGRDFDLRANAYLPLGERVKGAGSTPGSSFASIVGTAIEVTTLGATLREERALQGFDAEIGWRVPIWSVDDNKALRLYAGVFRFDDDVVEAVSGPHLRAELTMYELPYLPEESRLTLGAEFLDDDVRGSQGFALARLRIPLQAERSSDRRPLNWQERRMTDYVMRDVDIVTESHTTQAPTIVETATQTSDGDTITVINSASTPGPALDSAVLAAGAGSTVLLAGTFNTTDWVRIAANQTLTGTATVRTASGYTATINTGAAINAANAARAVFVNTGGTLSGLAISNTFSGGAGGYGVIIAPGASGVTIENNVISVFQSAANAGVGLAFEAAAFNTIVRNNTISAAGTGSASTMTTFAANAGAVEVAVSGNTLSATGGNSANYIVRTGAVTTITPGSTGNVRGGGTCIGAVASGAVQFTDGTSCP